MGLKGAAGSGKTGDVSTQKAEHRESDRRELSIANGEAVSTASGTTAVAAGERSEVRPTGAPRNANGEAASSEPERLPEPSTGAGWGF